MILFNMRDVIFTIVGCFCFLFQDNKLVGQERAICTQNFITSKEKPYVFILDTGFSMPTLTTQSAINFALNFVEGIEYICDNFYQKTAIQRGIMHASGFALLAFLRIPIGTAVHEAGHYINGKGWHFQHRTFGTIHLSPLQLDSQPQYEFRPTHDNWFLFFCTNIFLNHTGLYTENACSVPIAGFEILRTPITLCPDQAQTLSGQVISDRYLLSPHLLTKEIITNECNNLSILANVAGINTTTYIAEQIAEQLMIEPGNILDILMYSVKTELLRYPRSRNGDVFVLLQAYPQHYNVTATTLDNAAMLSLLCSGTLWTYCISFLTKGFTPVSPPFLANYLKLPEDSLICDIIGNIALPDVFVYLGLYGMSYKVISVLRLSGNVVCPLAIEFGPHCYPEITTGVIYRVPHWPLVLKFTGITSLNGIGGGMSIQNNITRHWIIRSGFDVANAYTLCGLRHMYTSDIINDIEFDLATYTPSPYSINFWIQVCYLYKPSVEIDSEEDEHDDDV